jgi:two-component system nitrogen regulation response regulator NtrX
MAQFILVYSHPEEGEKRFKLANDKSYRIGSKPDNEIVLPQNDVSRHHAILRVRDGNFHITDLDSKNGTFVNGQKVAAADFNCGDMIGVSSARLVVVEVGSGSFTPVPEFGTASTASEGGSDQEDTLGVSSAASAEEMVSLLVTTSNAVRMGAVAEPLNWAVERFALPGAAVLYRDKDDNVAMVSSAGDLGPLVRSSDTLAQLVKAQERYRGGTRIQQVNELGESILMVPMRRDHLLVARYSGQPPAIGDLRAVIAAIEAVLCSGNPPGLAGREAAERRDHEVRRFGSPLQRIAGLSDSIIECKRRAADVARRTGAVLITGENGTGKSLFARVIHDLSNRQDGPFVVFDCARHEPVEMEARLFGGGERSQVRGAVDQASEGTLHVKEVGHLPLEMQERLAEVVVEAPRRGGGEMRVIADTCRDVDAAVAEGVLSEKLLAAVGTLRLDLPALRDRAEDVPLLVTVFQREGGIQRGSRTGGFTVDAFEALATYDWPDNVRELRREVLRLMTCATADALVDVLDLAPHITEGLTERAVPPLDLGSLATRPLSDARDEFERWRILRALHDSGGNQTRAARELGLSRAGLFKKMRRLGMTTGANIAE